MFDNLEVCRNCGGEPEHLVEYRETAVGVKRFIAVRCKDCHSRTSLYMCEKDDPTVVSIIEDLWNKGRISNVGNS